ncbi:MAG: winged helix-turn-helix domain-containing protein [Defluviitaleaceae bacterium]|nr:winged helix-turn-helix domain-containing protein [Defluviitaleaceae bacterium]
MNGNYNNDNSNNNIRGEMDRLNNELAEMKELLKSLLGNQKAWGKEEVAEEQKAKEQSGAEEQATNNNNNNNKQGEHARACNWEEYGEQMREYGKKIAEHAKQKFEGKKGLHFGVYSGKDVPRPPKAPRPPRMPKMPKFGFFNPFMSDDKDFEKLTFDLNNLVEGFKSIKPDIDIDVVDLGLNPILSNLRKKVQDGERGVVTYAGGFRHDGGETYWMKKEVSFNDILSELHSSEVEKVLTALGSRQKLDILVALLQTASTVNELVAYLGLNSTGQAYHHLNALTAAGLVVADEEEKGVYSIADSRVEGLIMILAGVRSLIDAGE